MRNGGFVLFVGEGTVIDSPTNLKRSLCMLVVENLNHSTGKMWVGAYGAESFVTQPCRYYEKKMALVLQNSPATHVVLGIADFGDTALDEYAKCLESIVICCQYFGKQPILVGMNENPNPKIKLSEQKEQMQHERNVVQEAVATKWGIPFVSGSVRSQSQLMARIAKAIKG